MDSESLPDYGTLFPSTVTATGLPTIYYVPPNELSGPAASPTGTYSYQTLPSASLATTVNSALAAGTTASQGVSGEGGYQIVGWSSMAAVSPVPTTTLSPSSSSGLSSGARTGIIVASIVASLILLALLLTGLVFYRRKARAAKTQKRMEGWRRTSWEIKQKKQEAEQASLGVEGGGAPPAAFESGYHV